MINSQQISFVMMIKLKCFKCAQTEWIDNKTMKSIRVEDFFVENLMMFSHFFSNLHIFGIFFGNTQQQQIDNQIR